MLSSGMQIDVQFYLLCKCVPFRQSTSNVQADDCRQMEFGFLCISSDSVPLSHLVFFFFTSCFQEVFEQLTEYLIIRQL